MRPLGSCPELVVLQNCPCSNSISKLLFSRLRSLWTDRVGDQQSSFVTALGDINTIGFGLHTLMMFEITLYAHLFTICTNWETGQTRQANCLQSLAQCKFCLPELFIFHFSLISPPFACHHGQRLRRISGDLEQSGHTEREIMSLVLTKCLQMGNAVDEWQGSRKKIAAKQMWKWMRKRLKKWAVQRPKEHQHVDSRLC